MPLQSSRRGDDRHGRFSEDGRLPRGAPGWAMCEGIVRLQDNGDATDMGCPLGKLRAWRGASSTERPSVPQAAKLQC